MVRQASRDDKLTYLEPLQPDLSCTCRIPRPCVPPEALTTLPTGELLGDGWASPGAAVGERECMRLLPCCMLHVACLPELEIEVVQDVAIARCQDTIRRSRLHTSRHCARTHSPGARGSIGRSWRARHGGTWWFSSTLVSLYVIASALIVRTCDRRDCGFSQVHPNAPCTASACVRARVKGVCARVCARVSVCVCARECVRA